MSCANSGYITEAANQNAGLGSAHGNHKPASTRRITERYVIITVTATFIALAAVVQHLSVNLLFIDTELPIHHIPVTT